jgi:hypothetical protein
MKSASKKELREVILVFEPEIPRPTAFRNPKSQHQIRIFKGK